MYLVLLPQDALVLLLAADLLVVVQLLRHLLRHRGLPLHSDLFHVRSHILSQIQDIHHSKLYHFVQICNDPNFITIRLPGA